MAAEVDSEPRMAGSAAFETSTFADGDSGRTARVSLGSERTDRISLLVDVAAASVLRRLSDVSVQQRSASVVISNVHLKDCGERAERPATVSLYCTRGQAVTGPLVMVCTSTIGRASSLNPWRSTQSEQKSCYNHAGCSSSFGSGRYARL